MAAAGASRGLTPLDLNEARSLIGVPLRRTGHNRTATRPAISRWARSIGDRNPLWLDHEYGPRSSLGAHVAPPCWLFSVDDTCLAVKFPDWHVLYGGVDWEFHRWVRLGDDLTARSMITAVEEKNGRFCGPMVLQTGETEFKDQEGRLVARAVSRVLRTGRQAAVETGKYRGIAKTPFSSEQMLAIENDYDGEDIRGAIPRYWEELAVGQELTPVVRGPLTSEEIIQFISATRPSLGVQTVHSPPAPPSRLRLLGPRDGLLGKLGSVVGAGRSRPSLRLPFCPRRGTGPYFLGGQLGHQLDGRPRVSRGPEREPHTAQLLRRRHLVPGPGVPASTPLAAGRSPTWKYGARTKEASVRLRAPPRCRCPRRRLPLL